MANLGVIGRTTAFAPAQINIGAGGRLPVFTQDWFSSPVKVNLQAVGANSGGSESTPPQYIRARVLDADGYGIARQVFAIRRDTGERVARAFSGTDGSVLLRPTTTNPVILIAVPVGGEQLNCDVLDNILPLSE